MKKLILSILILALTYLSLNGQNNETLYGWAGQNTAPNYTAEVRGYIYDMIPEGGSFVSDFCQYKYTGKAPEIDIQNMIKLRDTLRSGGKFYYMIYSFDARNKLTLENNFYAFDKFREAGIDIIASRMDNESYAKAALNNNWALYMQYCAPILSELTAKGFTGSIIFPIRRPAEAGTWNANAIPFINSNPQYAPDCHPYYNKESAPVLVDIDAGRELPKEVVSANYLPSKDIFYSTLYSEITEGNFYTDFINYHRENFPNKKLFITEFGPPVGVGQISGTIGYEACYDWFLNQTLKDQDIIAAVCRFNGAGITGSITPLSKYDISTGTGFIKRLGYYTLRNFLANKDITGPNVISYHNLTREVKNLSEVISIPQGMRLQGAYFECLTGSNFYSSSGSCAWWNTGSVKTYEINDVSVYGFIPSLSYGYVHYTLEPIFIPIYGSSDTSCLNYVANANTFEDCIPKIYGSLDRDCANYRADANVIVPCIPKEPEPCMKKRWLFTSLPCRASKNVCNCN